MKSSLGYSLFTIWVSFVCQFVHLGAYADAISVVKKGYFSIAHDDSFAPFGSAERKENGEYKQSVGFEIDLLSQVIKQMSLKPSFMPDAWAKVLISVKVGTADAIATVGINDERKKSYDFSNPYANYAAILFVPKLSKAKQLKDLKGKKISIQKNHFAVPWIRDHYPEIEQVSFENAHDAFAAALNGTVEGAVADKLVGLYTIKESKDLKGKLKVVGSEFSITPVALAFAKDQKAQLRKKFNEALVMVQHSEEFSNIYMKWFGVANK